MISFHLKVRQCLQSGMRCTTNPKTIYESESPSLFNCDRMP